MLITDIMTDIKFFLAHLNMYLDVVNSVFPLFFPAILMIFGGVFGSFITCALYRVPRGISMRQPPSTCPSCQHKLGVADLVPVFSYLMAGGKCRHCKTSISLRYLILELLCVASGLVSWFVLGPQYKTFILFIALLCAVYIVWGFVESRHKAVKVLLFFIILMALLAF